MKKILSLIAAVLVAILALAGCAAGGNVDVAKAANQRARQHVQDQNASLTAPKIKHNTEYNNYFKAQSTYDEPSTILWCSFTWGNASAPLVTVPVAGKLTSSSVSLFPSSQVKDFYETDGTYNPELPSVDGMFHGSPPPYRYGFTPGGQYVDFFNMPTFCTTSLTSFQRQATKVTLTVDKQMRTAQNTAQAALADCVARKVANCPAAQTALESGLGQ